MYWINFEFFFIRFVIILYFVLCIILNILVLYIVDGGFFILLVFFDEVFSKLLFGILDFILKNKIVVESKGKLYILIYEFCL